MIRGWKDLPEKMRSMYISAEQGQLREVDIAIQKETSSGKKTEPLAYFKGL